MPRRNDGHSWFLRVRGHETPILRELPQPPLKGLSSPVQPRHDGTDRDVEDVGDLLVGETLQIGEEDRDAEVLRQFLHGLLDVRLDQPVEDPVFGGAGGLCRLLGADPAIEIEVFDRTEIDLGGRRDSLR